ncbi:TniQ family protein [Nocardia sp. 2YAB30]|uniref:TniQ family protein n=1 Tax=unclassified Nocardia TaxID=2637762 RepID=UPI003F990C6B
MKPWQNPAGLLPVRVRPVHAETLVSYIFRLADANALTRPTLLLRALGEPRGALPVASWPEHYEITLNTAAARRLEIFTGMPAARLRRALPALAATSPGPDPATPTFHGHRSVRLREHCQECVARLPGQPRIRVHDLSAPEVCRRHRRWVRITHTRPQQVDLSGSGAVLGAHRRLNRLCSDTGDRDWTMKQLAAAEYVAR